MAGVGKAVWKAVWDGFLGIAPAVPLLMMCQCALHRSDGRHPRYPAALGLRTHCRLESFHGRAGHLWPDFDHGTFYLLRLGQNLAAYPHPDAAGRPGARQPPDRRQCLCFRDGFSNLAYPTNAALLITLSLTVVPTTMDQWLLPLWLWIFLATVAFLGLAVIFHYGHSRNDIVFNGPGSFGAGFFYRLICVAL